MTAKRHIGRIAAALLTASLLTACGGSEDEPLVKPTTDAPTTTAPPVDDDGFTPEQRELADQVTAYFTGVVGRGSSPVDPIIRDLVTPDLLAQVSASEKKSVDDAGLQYLGEAQIDVTEVTITGDTATVEGCNNSSKALLVKKGQKKAGAGSQLLGYSTMTVGLVREDDRWLIDSPRLETVNRC